MPNWCYTEYVADGPQEQIQQLQDLLTKLETMPGYGLAENGFGANWLGNIVVALGEHWQDVDGCRGQYYSVQRDNDTQLSFTTESAWCELAGVRKLIEQKFPGVKLYFLSEELATNIFETNDRNGVYFHTKYYYSLEHHEEIESYYESFAELLDGVRETTGLSINDDVTLLELEEQIEAYCTLNDLCYTLCEVTICD